MKSVTDMAKEIRATLKEMGISSRQVSIRSGYCGYSDYIHAEIKDCHVDIREVEKVVHAYEHVRYDERTYEILEGANTYTRVQYAYEAFEPIIPDYFDRAAKLLKIPEGITGIAVTDTVFLFIENSRYILHDSSTASRCAIYDAKGLAKELFMIENFNHL